MGSATEPGSAIVTGAGRGIGWEIARRLLREGSAVVLVDSAAATLPAAAARLTEAVPGGEVSYVPGDVRDVSVADEAVSAAAAMRELRVLVNNAGIGRLSLIVDTSDEEWEDVVGISLTGTFVFTRAVARRLISQGRGGAIVNIASVNATAATDGFAHYCSAKAGVSMFTKVAASELGAHGIRVNGVAPGKTMVDPPGEPGADRPDDAFRRGNPVSEREFLARTPLGRLGRPDDIAAAVAFLCSPAAEWITGVTLPVDGGNHIRGLHSYWQAAQAAVSPPSSDEKRAPEALR